jgi:NAD(P)-dependent dehydrogenase (short-subunit alcohol dehydrogenase family)
MVEQICLVTGATSGIGRATAHELASRGASVVIHGRRPAELDATAADIRASTSNGKVTVLLADLASLGSIRQATDRFVAEHDRLHVLVNNAGVSLTHRSVTADGYETTFAVNHLAPFLLTNLLLELLQNSGSVEARQCLVHLRACPASRGHGYNGQLRTSGHRAHRPRAR